MTAASFLDRPRRCDIPGQNARRLRDLGRIECPSCPPWPGPWPARRSSPSPPPAPPTPPPSSRRCPRPSACSTRRAATSSSASPTPTPTRAARARRSRRPASSRPARSLPGNTGDVFEDRWNFSGAYKADLNDRLSYALIFDQPLWADTRYGTGSFPRSASVPGSLYGGSKADLKTYQITAALAYDVTPNVKIYGGLRAQRLEAEAAVSFVQNYRSRPTTSGATATCSAPPTSGPTSRCAWR